MKVNEYQQPDLAENRIDFYYRKKNKEVHDILSFLKSIASACWERQKIQK